MDKILLINDLQAHARNHGSRIAQAIARTVERGWFILGPEVESFEAAFARFVGSRHCVAVANGTDALELALRALWIGARDRVATIANGGMYATTAIQALGAEPFFLDVDMDTHLVSGAEIDRALDSGVKAIILTHLYGRAIPGIAGIVARCREAGVTSVEDCAQAHGAEIDGKLVGGFGDAGCFSFYPTKNLGALGDGGAIVCDDETLVERIHSLRQYGWSAKYRVELAGGRNSRLDEVQAAILNDLLPLLDQWNTRRRLIAARYSSEIRHPGLTLPPVGGANYVAHLYVLRSPRRDSLRDYLRDRRIATEVHYPVPDHRQPVFGDRYGCLSLANTERLAGEVLTLPCHPDMLDSDIQRVIDALAAWPL